MKKNLITLAIVGAAIAPTMAAADVSVYGRAQVEIGSFDDDANPNRGIELADQSMGRIGIKATEDLGDGLTGLAKFEFKADTTDNQASAGISLTARESMVGLKGGFGQIELGNLKSEYKYAGGVKYDAFVATNLQARGNGGMTSGALGHNGFLDNSIAYRGKAGAVKFGLTYAPEEDDGRMTASVKFGAKNYEAFVALMDEGDKGLPGNERASTKIGGMYKAGDHKIMFQHEMTENPAASSAEPTLTFLGYQGKFGKNTAVFQFGSTDGDGGTDVTYIALGAIHKFSKTTRVFGGFRSTEDDNAGVTSEETVISVGLRKDWK